MIVDAFLYNGEADMLALRVETIGPHVDRMVAVVCTTTHQGDPNDVQIVEDQPPVEYVRFTPEPAEGGNQGKFWLGIESQHRDYLAKLPGLKPDDILFVSDVDEIPLPESIDEIATIAAEYPVSVPMRMHGFALDYLYPAIWVGTTASTVAMSNPQAHRNWRYKLPKVGAGWHLSWMGSMEERRRKARSFSHNEHADLDVEHCWRNAIHVTKEIGELIVLTPDEFAALDWPALDAITVPASWRSPMHDLVET